MGKFYQNLKISKKILLGFFIVIASSALLLLCSLYFINGVGSLSQKMHEGPYVCSTQSMGVRMDINVAGKEIRSAMLEKDITKYESILNETSESIKKRMTEINASFTGDAKFIEDLESKLATLNEQRERVITIAKTGDYDAATNVVLTDYYEAFKTTATAAEVLYDMAKAQADTFNSQANKTSTQALITLIVIFIILIVLSILITILTAKAVVAPIKQVETAARALMSGDLSFDIEYVSNDELGSLSESMRLTISNLKSIIGDIDYLLNEMGNGNFDVKSSATQLYIGDYQNILLSMRSINTNLSDVLTQINDASNQVSSGADQVSSGAQALSQGATEQASSVEELAATINDISHQINTTSENAYNANKMVDTVGNEILRSNEQMSSMTSAIAEISESSTEIAKIIKTIEDIAFQTNILALNAAVEAARAGAAGKGFAVVADEVRNLASKSAEASKNTSALIESSIAAVANGTRIATETAKTLSVVVEGAKEVTTLVDKIALASKEQADSITQVTVGVDQISSVVQTNSATAEESAASSEELTGQAQMLKSLTNRFKLKSH